jgi:hypothetical protein
MEINRSQFKETGRIRSVTGFFMYFSFLSIVKHEGDLTPSKFVQIFDFKLVVLLINYVF